MPHHTSHVLLCIVQKGQGGGEGFKLMLKKFYRICNLQTMFKITAELVDWGITYLLR